MNEQIRSIGIEKAEETTEHPSVVAHTSVDILLAAIEHFCHHHTLPFSAARALRGVSTKTGYLLPEHFEQACRNVGLRASSQSIRPSSVDPMSYPFLALLHDGMVAIVEARNQDQNLEVCLLDKAGNRKNKTISKSQLDKLALGTVFYVTREAAAEELQNHTLQSDRHWFWSAVRKFWPNWSYVILATFLINVLGLALPLFVMNVYDRVIPNNSFSTLWALAAGVSIALFFDFLLKIMRSAMIDNSSKRIDLGVSANIFEHALDVKMEHRQSRSGEIANSIRDFEAVRDFFSSGAIAALIDLVFVGVFLAFLWFIVGELALVPLLAVPLVLLATLLVQFPLKRSIQNAQSASGNRHSVLVESLVGIEAIKSVGAEGSMQARWESAVSGAARAGAATRFWSNLAIYFTMFAQQAVSVIVIIWGVFLVADGKITIGALIAANILAGRILAPIGGIAGTLVRAQQAFAALASLNALMKLDRDNSKSRGTGATIAEGRAEFRNVNFTYPNDLSPAISSAGFTIAPGERVAIVGKVGSGKSTIGKLLSGLYHPAGGGVLVDGTDTRHIAAADLRKSSVYVGQETELFSGSLRDNLIMSGQADEASIKNALAASGVASFVSRHPLGLQMEVGERGKFLSGGQKQAVGIARALLLQPKILFLDEPTAQMDTLTETAFIKSFAQWITPEHTLVIATHRNSLLDLVERMIVIENGKVVLDGPKAQVLKSLSSGGKPAGTPKGAQP